MASNSVADRREKSQMLGDFFREAAVLVFVFLPLEQFLRGHFQWSTLIWMAVFAGPLLWYGMILEGREGI